MRERLLHRVRRPVQYIDGEVNAVHRAAGPGRMLWALAFPDTYELGMSHLGLKILYHLLNAREDAAAERVFCPEDDLAGLLRETGTPLATLESEVPLSRCQVVGFTLQSELHATTILHMLDLGGIPVRAAERGEEHPLVIGGGPQALNPEPLAAFFDAFVLGDGEEAAGDIVDAWWAWKVTSGPRGDLLARLAGIDGVYVPSLYREERGPEGDFRGTAPAHPAAPPLVERRVVPDLDRVPFPTAPPVPFMETTHDRLTVELARGCVRGCRFCHAGMVDRPYRERSPLNVERLALEGLARTGYDEVSLSALSTGDYCHLVPLARRLAALLKDRRISLSLPSIRPGSLPDDVIRDVGAVRKSGFTMAPEAGTDRLRRVVNKGITEEEILVTAADIFRHGWKSIKLYFMVGLPTETAEDVEAIVGLARRIRRAGLEAGVKGATVTVSVSPFVPKAHTPFQWHPMVPLDQLTRTVEDLGRRCRQAGIGFKWHHPAMSAVEGLLARGDRRLSTVIERVWRAGGRFEAWTDRFDLARWRNALAAEGLSLEECTIRPLDPSGPLPWSHLGTRVSPAYLLAELQRALEGTGTGPCRIGSCRACGACLAAAPPEREAPSGEVAPSSPPAAEQRFRVRLKYDKTGRMRWLAHLELFRLVHRSARRAGIPIGFSGGFNPHPRISFGPPLPVGAEGRGDLVDLELSAAYPAAKLVESFNAVLPEGLRVTAAQFVPLGAPALFDSVGAVRMAWLLPASLGLAEEEVGRRLVELLARPSIPVVRESGGKRREKNLRPFILEASASPAEDGRVSLNLLAGFTADGSIKPAEFLGLVFPDRWPWDDETPLRRDGLFRIERGRPVDAFTPPRPKAP